MGTVEPGRNPQIDSLIGNGSVALDHGRPGLTIEEMVDRPPVAIDPAPVDGVDAGRSNHRRSPPRLAFLHIGDVDLDGRDVDRLQRVVDGVGRVGERPGVEHDAVDVAPSRVDAVDEITLVVRLMVVEVNAEFGCPRRRE